MTQEILVETSSNEVVTGRIISDKILPKERMTFDEFLNWLDEDTWAEWVAGEVIVMSPASIRHQLISAFLQSILQFWVENHSSGKILAAPTLMKFEAHPAGREPDLMFIAKENLGKLRKNYLDGAADLVVEIISPESRARDRGDKYYEYEQAGVREFWLIDSDRRQAEFYVLNADGIYEFAPIENGIFQSRMLAGMPFKPEWLWSDELPNLLEILKEWKLV